MGWKASPAAGGGSDVGVRVRRTSSQTITTATQTSVIFDTEDDDDGGFWAVSPNPTRLTVPAGEGGWYIITGGVRWAASSSGNYRQLQVPLNAGNRIALNRVLPTASGIHAQTIAAVYKLSATDYLELDVTHDVGSDLDIDNSEEYSMFFSIAKILG